jgi:hypothetical protein
LRWRLSKNHYPYSPDNGIIQICNYVSSNEVRQTWPVAKGNGLPDFMQWREGGFFISGKNTFLRGVQFSKKIHSKMTSFAMELFHRIDPQPLTHVHAFIGMYIFFRFSFNVLSSSNIAAKQQIFRKLPNIVFALLLHCNCIVLH